MKSKKVKYITTALILFSLVGCSKIGDSLSKDEAKKLVIKEHTKQVGTPTIVSIKVKDNAYYVKWENIANKESGTDKVTDDAEIKMVDAQIE